jgi:hypothetical protein
VHSQEYLQAQPDTVAITPVGLQAAAMVPGVIERSLRRTRSWWCSAIPWSPSVRSSRCAHGTGARAGCSCRRIRSILTHLCLARPTGCYPPIIEVGAAVSRSATARSRGIGLDGQIRRHILDRASNGQLRVVATHLTNRRPGRRRRRCYVRVQVRGLIIRSAGGTRRCYLSSRQ